MSLGEDPFVLLIS